MPKQGRRNLAMYDNTSHFYSPFGTDYTPELTVKIIGGKRVWVPYVNPDPAIQPTKPMVNLQSSQDQQFRKIPKGRYDTTYRREYLNFGGGQPMKDGKSQLNQYTVLPPISPQRNSLGQSQDNLGPNVPSIEHLIVEPISKTTAENYGTEVAPTLQMQQDSQSYTSQPQRSQRDEYLPREPLQLSDQEEQSLMQDVSREMSGYSSEQLKSFYSELTTYDPNMTGYIHHMYVTLVAMRNKLPLNDPLLRFVMCRFVSGTQEAGYVNYEGLVKYLARCMGESAKMQNNNYYGQQQQQQQYRQPSPTRLMPDYARMDQAMDRFDPDEQAILRLLHENMKEWDKTHQIDTDSLRKQFYDLDVNKSYVMPQRQFEDILYKERLPIQRSLIYQILEKYCKAQTGLYRWPVFVDFLEKTAKVQTRSQGRRPDSLNSQYQTLDDKEIYASERNYRMAHLDTLRKKVSEEERMDEIERQIYNLQSLKKETQQRIDSRLGDVVQGESWFTRFMRLANAMYSHRVHAGIEFVLPKEEAARLINAYNTVYDLNIPEQQIQEGLNRCTRKGNVIIDDLIKVLAKVK